MPVGRVVAGVGIATALTLASCTDDRPDAADPAGQAPTRVSVTVPPERLSPFCQEMIDLTAQLRSGDVDDVEALIIETYRRIAPDAPNAIVDDFTLVLDALEAGEPPPTDPPRDTVATTPPPSVVSAPTTTPVGVETTAATIAATSEPAPGGSTAAPSVDEAFAPGDSPGERLNSYVTFECRDTANNPGPAPTQPAAVPVDTTG